MRNGQFEPRDLNHRKSCRTRSMALIWAFMGAALAGAAGGQVVTEFPVTTAASGPTGIAVGPDGNLWFTEYEANQIGRITTAGVITEYPVPTFGGYPAGITVGPDGNLWFAEELAGQIGRITTAGVITEFPVPATLSEPYGIASGPDGNLWFTDAGVNKIGRITTAGVITEFHIPTANSAPVGITAGSDGNLWFAESDGGKIGRITTAGVITEFPIATTHSEPNGITAGPDGNVWFVEYLGNQIGQITPAGVITEFPIPTDGAGPEWIVAGPDNLWFTEHGGNQVGRVTTAGVIKEFSLPTDGAGPEGIASYPHGDLWFTEFDVNQIGSITRASLIPEPMEVDANSPAGSSSNVNGVLEPGETVQVAPTWMNTLVVSQSLGGVASALTGPAGPTYTIDDTTASYGTLAGGASANCNGASGDCYLMTVSGTRPAQHWDATFTETLANPVVPSLPVRTWTLHVGNSFPDVPTSHPDYAFVENLFHNGITGGCTGGNYCPSSSVTRAQMAVFLMKSKLGKAETPPPATGTVFSDVPASNPFAPFIEQLAGFEITGGCGGGDYCPDNPVTRAQMAVFLLKAKHGSAYLPPACTGIFSDVECTPTPAFAVDWIEQLFHEGITSGCGGGQYCPASPNTRGQMAVFLVKTFALQLYGP